jgi:hypothetical protein
MRMDKADMRGLITCIGISLLIGLIGCLVLSGCNVDMVDTVYQFDYAIIELPNGEIVEGEVETWRDYEDGEQLQVKINGKTYLTSSYHCTLIKEG